MNSPSSGGERWWRENCLVSFYQDSPQPPIRGLATTQQNITYYPGWAVKRTSIDGKNCWLDGADFGIARVKNDSLNIV